MKTKIVVLLMLFSIFVFSEILFSDEIEWLISFPEAIEQADKSSKIIMIDFTAEWCSWCKKMDETTFQDSNVIQLLNEKFIPTKLDVDLPQNKEIPKLFNVKGYPTTLFINADSSEVNRIGGYLPGKDFFEKVTDILNNKNYFQDLSVIAEMFPDSTEIQIELAELYETRGKFSESEKIYSRILLSADESKIPEIKTKIAILNFSKNNFDEALEQLKAIENDFPDYSEMDEILFNQAICLYRLQLPNEVKIVLEKIKQDFPQSQLIENVNKFLEYLSSN
ncbi:MAG: DUF255 domain-containing protein [Candidatus Cloacimonetes bacterium]|nr:DUF255 domain-containing protein [Candidatus Cloacimonadota bacterium]